MAAGRRFQKMSADDLATIVINAMARDKIEIYPGQARLLKALHLVSPRAAYRTVKKR